MEQEASDQPLEERVTKTPSNDKKSNLTQIFGQVVQGYGIPLLGAIGGYSITKGPGGAGVGMMLTSFGMLWFAGESNESTPRITLNGYTIGLVVGATMTLMRCFYGPKQ